MTFAGQEGQSGAAVESFYACVPAFLAGTDSPREYLERCLAVIADREPQVRAWVVLRSEEARAEADVATKRYRAGRPLSRIDGMPVGVKDVLSTKDLPTGLGWTPYAGRQTHADSAAVRALRDAGGIVLGKTVTTEFAGGDAAPTVNPHDAERTPGGSSSGSAAAVAAHMVPATLGSQVGGSIIRPAGYCGTFAIKPTLGAINRGEYRHLSHDCIGAFAGSLADLWHLTVEVAQRAGGDAGYPGLNATTAGLPLARQPSRLIVLETEGWSTMHAEAHSAFTEILAQLTASGVDLVRRGDDALVDAFERSIAQAARITGQIIQFEGRWLLENLAEQFPGTFSPSSQRQLEHARGLTIDDYRSLLGERDEARQRLASLTSLADGLISVTAPGPAPRIDTGEAFAGLTVATGSPAFNMPASMLGAPALALPMMTVDRMPVGVQLVGQLHDDGQLIAIAGWMTTRLEPVVRTSQRVAP